MKRKLLVMFLAMATAIACAFGITACGGKGGDDSDGFDKGATEGVRYTLNEDGKSYCVAGLDDIYLYDIVFSSKYNGLPVTSIGKEAFKSRSQVTSVTIPDSVTSIGSYAFSDCDKLKSITLGNGITAIPSQICYKCYELESVTFGNKITTIGFGAFWQCKLTSVTIPDGVTVIEHSAFGSCDELTSVTIPKSVTSIGNSAFMCKLLNSINYSGTKADWDKITKEDYAFNYTETVHCSDGDLILK